MLLRVRIVFIRQCLAWMVYGVLEDPGAEFFVQLRSRHHHGSIESPNQTVEDMALRIFENVRSHHGASRNSSDSSSSIKEHRSLDWNLLYVQVWRSITRWRFATIYL